MSEENILEDDAAQMISESIQEQQEQIDALQSEINNLKGE